MTILAKDVFARALRICTPNKIGELEALENAEAALLTKNPQELKAVATLLSTIILEGDGIESLTKPFFIVVDALPNVNERLKACKKAYKRIDDFWCGDGMPAHCWAFSRKVWEKIAQLEDSIKPPARTTEIAGFVRRWIPTPQQ